MQSGSIRAASVGERHDNCMQKTITTPRITFTRRQLEEIQAFKADLKAGRQPEYAFDGTIQETVTFLKGAKDIVDSLRH